MNEKRKFPDVITHSELKRVIWSASQSMPHCRIGQAVCNQYDLPQHLENMIWEVNDLNHVANLLMENFIN